MKVVATSGKEVTPTVAMPKPAPIFDFNRVPWQRLALSILGIAICLFEWRWATEHLYSLPAGAIAAFTTITVNSLYVVGALVVFFVTGRLVYEWKATTANQLVTQVTDTYALSTTVPPPKAFDDPSIK
jgi:hypothetical protein